MPQTSDSTKRRKSGLFGSVLLGVIVVVACTAFLVTGHVKQMASELSGVSLQRVNLAGAANARLADGFIQTILAVHSTTDGERRAHLAAVPPITASMTESLEKFQAIHLSEQDRLRVEKFKEARRAYSEAREACFELLKKDPQQASVFLTQKLLPLYSMYDQAGEDLWSDNIVQAKNEGEQIVETARRTQMGLTVGAILAVFFGFSAGFYRIVSSLEW
jgi:hypothetical protein